MDIINIFNLYNDGLNYREISKRYDFSSPTISNIINKEHYYLEVKKKYNLKKERYSYVFYNLAKNKFHKVENFSEFCKNNELNDKMMMPLMLGRFKKTFITNWTVFRVVDFSLSELRKRIKINNNVHVLYKEDVEYRFKSVSDFCRQHKIDETTTYHVLNGTKESVKGNKIGCRIFKSSFYSTYHKIVMCFIHVR